MPEPSVRAKTLDGLSQEGCREVEGANGHRSWPQKSRGVGIGVAIDGRRAETSQ